MKSSAVKSLILDEVADIRPLDDLEKSHQTDAIAWINSGANIFRIEKPDKPPKHLVSYFVVIDPEQNSLLLGDHIKAQLWLPSGGHVGLNEHPKDTVIRESKEELSQEAVFLKNYDRAFFVTIMETVGLTPGHTDVSLWYLLRGSVHDKIDFERREFNDMAWFTLDEISQSHPAIFDAHMHRFTIKLKKHLT